MSKLMFNLKNYLFCINYFILWQREKLFLIQIYTNDMTSAAMTHIYVNTHTHIHVS